jgi:ABC-type transport system involved in Fe-S cluster assembly, permease component
MSIHTTINNIPAPTWNWLKINNAPFSYSASVLGADSPVQNVLPAGVSYKADAGSDAGTYSGIATGVGKNIDSLFTDAGVRPALITAARNTHVSEPVCIAFNPADGSSTASSQIIRAEEGSSVTVIISYTSDERASGFQTVRTLCSAGKNAFIHLVKVQLLGSSFTQIDDTGTDCEEGGRVEITQIILGGKETFAGVASRLSAYQSSFKSDTAYLCRGSQKLDMNYVVRHLGKKTDSKMIVKGTLLDTAEKTYRGSIDFKNGCSGATGNEQEEPLLLTPSVVNKSIPLILCDEEDVAGEHGATIGRLGEDTLFYMQSRGISKQAAEEIMARAKVSSVASLVPDETIVTKIHNYLDKAFAHE